jgi:hypothetical protein
MMRPIEELPFIAAPIRFVPDEFEANDRPPPENNAAAIHEFVRRHVQSYAARLHESRRLRAG